MPLDALRECDPPPHEVIVVDNGSTDGTSAFVLDRYPEVILVRAPKNLGFAGGNNLGMLNATGDVLVLLNDDTEPESDWLAALDAAFVQDSKLGVAGVRLLYPDRKTIQHLGGVVEPNGLTQHLDYGLSIDEQTVFEPREVDYATGAALAARREAVREIGMLDEGFWPIYFEEVDWCFRAREAGWGVRVIPDSTVIHHESQTTEKFSRRFLTMYARNRWRFLLKHQRGWDLMRSIRAEARWMARHRPWDNLWPLAQAYAWAAIQWREIESLRRNRR